MATSLVGDGEDKPAFWTSGVRSGLQTAARTVEKRTMLVWRPPPTAPARQKTLRHSEGNPPGGRNQLPEARTAAHSAGRLVPTAKRRGTKGERTQCCRSPTSAAENRPLPRATSALHQPARAAKVPNRPKQPAVFTSALPQASSTRQPAGPEQHLLAPRRQQRPRLPPPRPPISIVDSLILRPES